MPIELTQSSAIEYENIIYGNLTPAMAADYLRNGQIIMRSFSDTLKEMYPAPDLTVTPDMPRSSISKKIRNWVSGKNHPTKREDVFRIAFALRLNEQQLNYLLCLCTDYCIQYRAVGRLFLHGFCAMNIPIRMQSISTYPCPQSEN